ncbi:hypothetical protein GE061_008567 [Apolygus lucorum]|uniref:Uncharacterized protein n=1 Tax=Apolygus lucorum TaxID=248454 RepID=A0A8S9WKA7_APOLU|nr:hypothetical protein GE061_008567 [Apolygus lucorum]
MGCFGSAASRADHEESKRGKEMNKKINQQLQKDKQVYRATHRLLLLEVKLGKQEVYRGLNPTSEQFGLIPTNLAEIINKARL